MNKIILLISTFLLIFGRNFVTERNAILMDMLIVNVLLTLVLCLVQVALKKEKIATRQNFALTCTVLGAVLIAYRGIDVLGIGMCTIGSLSILVDEIRGEKHFKRLRGDDNEIDE